jgi:hypothetical protein
MASRFRMQIVDTVTGDVVEYEPGRRVETEFVSDCINRIVAQGVGFFKTEATVKAAVEAGIKEAIFELKTQVRATR